LISGHSLAIDESSMTGESKIVSVDKKTKTFNCFPKSALLCFITMYHDQVHKDQRAPFLMSGCKVADGYGSMLVSITIFFLGLAEYNLVECFEV